VSNPAGGDLERGRRRLLVAVFTLLTGFAGLSMMFSLAAPDLLTPLQNVPLGARLGAFVLTVAFMALVWERERELRRLSGAVTRQQLLIVAFESRVRALEALIAAGDRLNMPLGLDDALSIVLDAAVELTGAQGGEVLVSEELDGVAVDRSHERPAPSGRILRVPLEAQGKGFGVLELTAPEAADGFDDSAVEVLHLFAGQAAAALNHADIREHHQASVTFLRASNVVKSKFLATVSHELRTPLTSVIGYASTLCKHWDRLPEAQKTEFVESIKDQGMNLGRCVERLLQAVRVELDEVAIEPVRHDVRKSVVNALSLFPQQERLAVNLPEDPVVAEVDPLVVDQAISNLVDNALRFTRGRVEICLEMIDQRLLLSVRDQGGELDSAGARWGPNPENMSEHRVYGGPGFGLHIVRSLVAHHYGSLELKSEGPGTMATIELPGTPIPAPNVQLMPVAGGIS
jgi:signal transduction histidine kinase